MPMSRQLVQLLQDKWSGLAGMHSVPLVERLYISGTLAARDPAFFRKFGITHVIACNGEIRTNSLRRRPFFPHDCCCLSLQLDDASDE